MNRRLPILTLPPARTQRAAFEKKAAEAKERERRELDKALRALKRL